MAPSRAGDFFEITFHRGAEPVDLTTCTGATAIVDRDDQAELDITLAIVSSTESSIRLRYVFTGDEAAAVPRRGSWRVLVDLALPTGDLRGEAVYLPVKAR